LALPLALPPPVVLTAQAVPRPPMTSMAVVTPPTSFQLRLFFGADPAARDR
jgi:hypothetical protein